MGCPQAPKPGHIFAIVYYTREGKERHLYAGYMVHVLCKYPTLERV